MDLPQRAIREQMASAIDLIVHQIRLKDGTRRITHITEVEGMEGDVITLLDVFRFDFRAGRRRGGQAPGDPAQHRPAPPLPGHARRPRPARAAGDLQLRRAAAMTLIPMAALVFAALLVLALLLLGALRGGDRSDALVTRIERYGPQPVAAAADGDGRVASTAVGWTARLLASGNADQRLARRLDLAGISRRPAEWALLGGCASVVLAALLSTLLGNAFVGILAGALGGWLGMRLTLSIKIGRRRAAFSEQLPNVLQLVAGLPADRDSRCRRRWTRSSARTTQPAAAEFARALAEARLGVDLDVALEGVAGRMDSDDLRWTVMAIRIQREVGGNLAEVLRNTVGHHARTRLPAPPGTGADRRGQAVRLHPGRAAGTGRRLAAAHQPDLHAPAVHHGHRGCSCSCRRSVLVVVGALWMRNLIKVEV